MSIQSATVRRLTKQPNDGVLHWRPRFYCAVCRPNRISWHSSLWIDPTCAGWGDLKQHNANVCNLYIWLYHDFVNHPSKLRSCDYRRRVSSKYPSPEEIYRCFISIVLFLITRSIHTVINILKSLRLGVVRTHPLANWVFIGSGNSLSLVWQWRLLFIGPFPRNSSKSIVQRKSIFWKQHFKKSYAKCCPAYSANDLQHVIHAMPEIFSFMGLV